MECNNLFMLYRPASGVKVPTPTPTVLIYDVYFVEYSDMYRQIKFGIDSHTELPYSIDSWEVLPTFQIILDPFHVIFR